MLRIFVRYAIFGRIGGFNRIYCVFRWTRMNCTRREFLRWSATALIGAAAGGPILSGYGCAGRRFPDTMRSRGRVLADLHMHVDINAWIRQTPLGVKYPILAEVAERFVNTTGMDWEKCYAAGIDLICAAHFNVFDEWLSMPTDPNPKAAANTHRMMDHLEAELQGKAAAYAKLARNSEELEALLMIPKDDPDYRIAIVHTIEGGHALGGDIRALEPLANRGVAIITLTHFFNKGIASAVNSYPYFPDANSSWPYQGLSEFGRDVLLEMERLGIIADVIHCTSTAIDDILKISTKPLIATHASARALGDHPYSLYDEHIQHITQRGGMIGVIIDPYLLGNYATPHDAEAQATLRDVVRTIRYIVKICGSHRHVGIGSDFAGYVSGPVDMTRLSQIGRLQRLLHEEFADEQMVEDILANNAIEFLLKNWRSGR
jgi:microsomal dipeptidase-like Zn-dependent dipeptidase